LIRETIFRKYTVSVC